MQCFTSGRERPAGGYGCSVLRMLSLRCRNSSCPATLSHLLSLKVKVRSPRVPPLFLVSWSETNLRLASRDALCPPRNAGCRPVVAHQFPAGFRQLVRPFPGEALQYRRLAWHEHRRQRLSGREETLVPADDCRLRALPETWLRTNRPRRQCCPQGQPLIRSRWFGSERRRWSAIGRRNWPVNRPHPD